MATTFPQSTPPYVRRPVPPTADALPNWLPTEFGSVQRALSGKQSTLVFEVPNAASLQSTITSAVNAGGGIVYCSGTLNLTNQITIGSNVCLLCDPSCTFTTPLTGTGLPTSFFKITGQNVLIPQRVSMSLGQLANGPTNLTYGWCIEIANGASNVTIVDPDIRYFAYGIKASGLWNDIKIIGGNYLCQRVDLHFAGINVSGSDLYIERTKHLDRSWLAGVGGALFTSAGAIHAAGGFYEFEGSNLITDTIYLNQFVDGIQIVRPKIGYMNGRPLFITNAQHVDVEAPDFRQQVGRFGAAGVCDDCAVFDLVRDGSMRGAKLFGGGENGIDLLSCQSFTVSNFTCQQTNTAGIAVAESDAYLGGFAPALSKQYLVNRKIVIDDCDLEAYTPIAFGLWDDVAVGEAMTYRQFAGSTNFAGSAGNVPLVLVQGDPALSSPTNPFLINRTLKVGGRPDWGPRAQVSSIDTATGIITTTAAHGFTTGEAVEWEWGGDVHQVILPTGPATGTSDAGGTNTILPAAAGDFITRGVQIGDRVLNVTTGATALVTAVTATQLTGLLSSGVWTAGDTYRVLMHHTRTYFVASLSATTLRLCSTFANAIAGTGISITNAGGGVGQILFLVRTNQGRLFIDGSTVPQTTVVETLEFNEALGQRQDFLFSAMTAMQSFNLGQGRSFAFHHALDPYIDHYPGNQRGNKSFLAKWLKLPPYYSNGTTTYGVAVIDASRIDTAFVRGANIHAGTYAQANGTVRCIGY